MNAALPTLSEEIVNQIQELNITIQHINKHIIEYATLMLQPNVAIENLKTCDKDVEVTHNFVRYSVLHNFNNNGEELSFENRCLFEKEFRDDELIKYLPLLIQLVREQNN